MLPSCSCRYIYTLICIVLCFSSLKAQTFSQNYGGEVCMIDSVNGPTVLCDMSELKMDSFNDMPKMNDATPQPDKVCNVSSGTSGNIDNVIWYAFQAESNTIDLDIEFNSCAGGGDPTKKGIQAGIYADCTFKEILACSSEYTASPINLTSNDLVPGQTYYLFIDGYAGSYCRYKLTLNAGADAGFSLDDLTPTLENKEFTNNKICTGATALWTLEGADADYYYWELNEKGSSGSPLSQIDKGIDTFSYTFNTNGEYTLSAFAYNYCDTSKIVNYDIIVDSLPKEVFEEITLCGNCAGNDLSNITPDCLISGDSLHLQNPNSDDIKGWVNSTTIVNSGTYSEQVILNNGCSYVQEVNVVLTELNPSIEKDTFVCSVPFHYQGTDYYVGDVVSIVSPFGGSDGCDQPYKYKIDTFKLDGTVIISCLGSSVKAEYVLPSGSSYSLDDLVIDWYEGFDALGTGSSINTLEQDKSYSARIGLLGIGCTKDLTFNTNDLTPIKPDVPEQIVFCSNMESVDIIVQNAGDFNYVWNIPSNIEYTVHAGSDTVTVRNNSQDFDFTVYAKDGCGGQSSVSTGRVIFRQAPEATFTAPEKVCVNVPFEIKNTSASNQFNWDFGSAALVSGDPQDENSPITLVYNIAGDYQITLSSQTETCESDVISHKISAIEKPSAPDVSCDASISNQLTFTWPDEAWMSGVIVNVSPSIDPAMILLDKNKGQVILQHLTTKTEYTVELIFDYGADCGIVSTTQSCTPVICNKPDNITIEASPDEICYIKDQMPIVDLTVNNHTGGDWYLDNSQLATNSFDPNQFGVGKYTFSYHFAVDGCNFSENKVVNVYPQPTFNIEQHNDGCNDADGLTDVVLKPGGNGSIIVKLDDKQINPTDTIKLAAGTYTAQVISTDNCINTEKFVVNDLSINTISISGPRSMEAEIAFEVGVAEDAALYQAFQWYVDMEERCADISNCEIEGGVKDDTLRVCLEAKTLQGCDVKDCIKIAIYSPVKLNIANAFSPNGDNRNDLLTLLSRTGPIEVMAATIFDRFGNVMHSKKDFIVDDQEVVIWDGKVYGDYIAPGVYTYMLKYKNEEGETEVKVQDLTIIR